MKSALIIGASRGLGLGLVREHLARGWQITATVRTRSQELEVLREGVTREAWQLEQWAQAIQWPVFAALRRGKYD